MDYYKNQSYYDILGVSKDASLENIEKAKNRLKFGNAEDRAPFSMWDKIDEAYKVLTNPEKRSEYDKELEIEENNIYSNSDKSISSINNGNINSTGNKSSSISSNSDETLESEILPKLKKVGKNIVLAVPTAILAAITIIKELDKDNQYLLIRDESEKEIKEPQTEESRLEEEYRKNIEEQIIKKMSEYHYNYDLQIDKVRLENRIALLKERIKQKENQVVKKSGLLKYKLELTALRNELDAFYRSLEKVEEKINTVNKNGSKQRLTKINEELYDVNKKIKELSESPQKRLFALKKLEVRRENLKKARNCKIQKQAEKRVSYGIFKESFISSYARTENFVENLLVPIDKIDEKNKQR